MSQQLIDLAGPLVGPGVGQEGPVLFGGRQRADGVDGHPPQELAVAGQVRGDHVEPAELGEHLAVDEVDLGGAGVLEPRRQFGGDQHAHRQHIAPIGDDDGCIARLAGLDPAQRGDLDHGIVIGAEVAQGSDVLAGAVGEDRLDDQLADLARFGKGILGRNDLDLLDLAIPLAPAGSPGDPFTDDLILPAIPAKAGHSFVLDLAGSLEQQQAAVGVGGVEPASLDFAGQGQVILLRVVAEQRQTQTALALEGAVTGAGSTAGSAQDAHDVALEVHRGQRPAVGQLDLGGMSQCGKEHQETEGQNPSG